MFFIVVVYFPFTNSIYLSPTCMGDFRQTHRRTSMPRLKKIDRQTCQQVDKPRDRNTHVYQQTERHCQRIAKHVVYRHAQMQHRERQKDRQTYQQANRKMNVKTGR